jgi:hypothetical protein
MVTKNVGNKFVIGHKHEDITKKRMSESHMGIKPDEETRKLMSEKKKEYWRLKKAKK